MGARVIFLGDTARDDLYHFGDEVMQTAALTMFADAMDNPRWLIADSSYAAKSGDYEGLLKRPSFSHADLRELLDGAEDVTQHRAYTTEVAEVFGDACLLVITGGGNLASGFEGLIAERLFFARVARVHQVPLVLTSQGIGPFQSDDAERATKEILRHAACIGVREVGSRRTCRSLGVPRRRVRVTGDDALAFSATPTPSAPSVVVSLDPHLWATQPDTVPAALAVAGTVAKEQSLPVTILPQTWTLGPSSQRTDESVVPDLVALLQRQGLDVHVARLTEPDDVINVLASARVLISSRYHPLVFAQRLGTPTVFISSGAYTRQKAGGFVTLVHGNARVIDTPVDERALAAAVRAVMERPDNKKRMNRSLEKLARRRRRFLDACVRIADASRAARRSD